MSMGSREAGRFARATGPGRAVAALVPAALVAVLLLRWNAMRAASREEQRCRQALVRAARIVLVGELSASIAHEIHQPLSAIRSNADAARLLLGQPSVPTQELPRILDCIRCDTVRAQEVIHRLRKLLERGTLVRRDLNLHALLEEVIKMLGDEAQRRGVVLVLHSHAARAMVLGDEVQLQQVMLNVILNAMDAMRGTAAAARTAFIETRDGPGHIVVQVHDRGHGFSPDEAEALFQAFFTTKDGGMGLGLSISRSILEAHGGTIHAASRSGGGAVFTIRLPVRPEPAHAEAVDPVQGAGMSPAWPSEGARTAARSTEVTQ
ncbi:sensor histidine kinase [Caldimonas brevitalea]|uniref:histidine kinase n=1 Tax=Caldimonas brevitalea TaxID=413882 RepID=A0A0G3BPP3_9BURK|nr:ATP-binding protein [Caldimonas brevitalea]AKJ29311.1 two-component oxygen-sensor histidine kinase FixL [Caldimonas brevitalea]